MPITDRYLKDPASFPSPDQGEPWGDEELWIDFVGGPYHVTGLNDIQRRRLGENFAEVCIEALQGQCEPVQIQVRRLAGESFRSFDLLPPAITFELAARPDHVRVAGLSLCGRIECAGATAGSLWAAADDYWFTRNVFENFFRMLVTYRLLESGGLLLHSAGIVDNGRAYLFLGRSGAGKSTLSRLSLQEGRTVLSDDMNALTWRQGEPWVEKVPFAGDLGRSWSRSDSYPLRALLALEKSDHDTVSPLDPVRATALIASCAPYLNADPYRTDSLLENLEKLTTRIPAHILRFTTKGGVWPVIERGVLK